MSKHRSFWGFWKGLTTRSAIVRKPASANRLKTRRLGFLEPLEDRQLLSVTTITGTSGNDAYRLVASGTSTLVYVNGGSSPSYTVSQVHNSIEIDSGAGNDTVTIDEGSGEAIPGYGLVFNAGSGTNHLSVINSVYELGEIAVSVDSGTLDVNQPIWFDSVSLANGSTLSLTAANQQYQTYGLDVSGTGNEINIAGGSQLVLPDSSSGGVISANATLTKSGDGQLFIGADNSYALHFGTDSALNVTDGSLILNSDMGVSRPGYPSYPSLNVSGGSAVTLGASQELKSLNISGNASVTLASGGDKMIQTDGFSIDETGGIHGTLDLGNGGMIIESTSGARAGVLADVSSLIGNAEINVDLWDWSGAGITSSAARWDWNPANPDAVYAATLGSALNADVSLSTFHGVSVNSNSVLIGYSLIGDANLDGVYGLYPSGADYLRWNDGITNSLTGWYNGDFDYDGTVSISDYFALEYSHDYLSNIADEGPGFLAAAPSSPINGKCGNLVTFSAAATDPDLSGSDLTYSIENPEDFPGDGPTIDPNTGLVTWVPSAGSEQYGDFAFTVTVEDTDEHTNSQIYNVHIDYPTLSGKYIFASEGVPGDFDKIPRLSGFDENNVFLDATGFDDKPFVYALNNGPDERWSDPANWSTNEVPGDDSDVMIPTGVSMVYDVDHTNAARLFNVEVGGKLSFTLDGPEGTLDDVTMKVGTLYVLPSPNGIAPAGELDINMPTGLAQLTFIDEDWGVGSSGSTGYKLQHDIDKSHFTGGLIAYGTVNFNGASDLEYNPAYADDFGEHSPLADTDRENGEQDKIATWSDVYGDLHATDTTITLEKTVSGWKEGDTIAIPDTRLGGLDWPALTAGSSAGHWETAEISGVSYDGSGRTVLTLASGLAYDHLGFTSQADTSISQKPMVGLITRNVLIDSESPGDANNASGYDITHDRARAHTIFGGTADVHVTFTQFQDLGRTDDTESVFATTDQGTAVWDPAHPDKAMLGSNADNQNGRYAVHLHHLIGSDDPSKKYSFVFDGNSIEGSKKWALALHDSSFGDVRGNVIYDAQGAGIVTEDGSEVSNSIKQNFVAVIRGDNDHGHNENRGGMFQNDTVPILGGGTHALNFVEKQVNSDLAKGGDGIWMRRSGNDVEGNVTMDTASDGYTISSYYLLMDVVAPAAKGLDKSLGGANAVTYYDNPAGTFKDNTSIGMTENGAEFIYVSGDPRALGSNYGYEAPVFTVDNLRVFNSGHEGIASFYTTNMYFLNTVIMNDSSQWTVDAQHSPVGYITSPDYGNTNTMFDGGVVEGFMTGLAPSQPGGGKIVVNSEEGTYQMDYLSGGVMDGALASATTFKNMKLKNWVNLDFEQGTGDKAILLDNIEFHDGIWGGATVEHPNPNGDVAPSPHANIWMDFDNNWNVNMLAKSQLFLKNGATFYDAADDEISSSAITGDHQIYFGEQGASYTIPQSDYGLVHGVDSVFLTHEREVIGQPGDPNDPMNNADLWDAMGVTAAGAVAPSSGTYAASNVNSVWKFLNANSGGPAVMMGALQTDWLMPTGEQRIGLITFWDGLDLNLHVHDNGGVAYLYFRSYINGGLLSGETVDLSLVDDATPTVTWHAPTSEALGEAFGIGTGSTASIGFTLTVSIMDGTSVVTSRSAHITIEITNP